MGRGKVDVDIQSRVKNHSIFSLKMHIFVRLLVKTRKLKAFGLNKTQILIKQIKGGQKEN